MQILILITGYDKIGHIVHKYETNKFCIELNELPLSNEIELMKRRYNSIVRITLDIAIPYEKV